MQNLSNSDQENLIKSSQSANLLIQDLRELVKSENPLLADIAIEVLERVMPIEKRLRRLEALAQHESL